MEPTRTEANQAHMPHRRFPLRGWSAILLLVLLAPVLAGCPKGDAQRSGSRGVSAEPTHSNCVNAGIWADCR